MAEDLPAKIITLPEHPGLAACMRGQVGEGPVGELEANGIRIGGLGHSSHYAARLSQGRHTGSVTAAFSISDLVAQRVSETGPIPFSEYMELALYSEPLGFYRRNVPGPAADYRTSPTLSPHFGTLAGRQLHAMWDSLGRPESFRVAEAGAGDASLAKSVANSIPDEFRAALEWCFVEPLAPVGDSTYLMRIGTTESADRRRFTPPERGEGLWSRH